MNYFGMTTTQKLEYRSKTGCPHLYYFACGYTVKTEKDSIKVEIYQESSTFHVRVFDRRSGERVGWQVFDHLSEAWRHFKKMGRHITVSRYRSRYGNLS